MAPNNAIFIVTRDAGYAALPDLKELNTLKDNKNGNRKFVKIHMGKE